MAVLTEQGVKEALAEHKGNMAAVGRQFKVSRTAVWQFCDKRIELKEYQRELREGFVDEVENCLYKNATTGNVTAQIFILKTLGRDRGYVERQEVTGANGGAVEVFVRHVKRDSDRD